MRRGLVCALLLSGIALAACSGDESPEATAAPEVSSSTEEDGLAAEEAPAAEETPEAEGTEQAEEGQGSGSSLTVTGEVDRSDVEVRVAEILSDLEAEAEPEGAVVEIPDTVLFDFDSADLRPEASEVLDGIVEVLELLENAPAIVKGHTDNVGDDDYNLQLSKERAEAVADHLIDAGIDPGLLTTEGLGPNDPVADNTLEDGSDNPEGRARNRRVEVVLPTVDLDDLPSE